MSMEPEDALEEALRGDLPTPDVEARVRRRLLGAGLAIGNGVATTAAGASAGAASVAVKAGGLSWGLKVGLAALVGIPTVGLWLDGGAPSPASAPMPAPARALEAKPQPTAAAATLTTPRETSDAAPQAVVERPSARPAKTQTNDTSSPDAVMASPAHPSQAEFSGSEQLARAPQVQSTLAEETRLLDAAFAALTAGDRRQAASLLQEHERRFPAGLLQKERERANTRLTEMSRGE